MHEIETTDVLLKPGEKKELFLVNMHEAKHNFFVFKQQKETEEYSTTANIAEVPLFTLFSLANIRLLDRQIVSSGCQDITSPTTSLIPSYNEKPKIKRRVVECTKFTLTKL